MYLVSLQRSVASAQGLRGFQQEIHSCPAPPLAHLRARYWSLEARALCGYYLFSTESSARSFLSDPLTADSVIARILSHPAFALHREPWDKLSMKSADQFSSTDGSPVALPAAESVADALAGLIEEIALDPFVRPIFIVSAPRAGSTMLYDLLSKSVDLWTIGGESQGVIEGIPSLHPANRGYDSHRLTAADADAETVRALRCGFVSVLRDRWARRYLNRPTVDRPPGVRMLEKTPENSLRVDFLRAAFPDARFIFLYRDARRNISSMVEAWRHEGFVNIPSLPDWERRRWHLLLPTGWRALNGKSLSEIAAFQWQAANQTILEDFETLPRDRWCVLSYDELIANPQAVAQKLCGFMGIRFEEYLKKAGSRPLPLSDTTISPPSPTKWRFNRDFDEAVLREVEPLAARLDELRRETTFAAPQRVRRRRISYSCFLDEYDEAEHVALVFDEETLIVDPSFCFQLGATVPLELLHRTRFREHFLHGHPLVWIEDPATSCLYPFWVRPGPLGPLYGLVPGLPAKPSLSAQLRRSLAAQGVLTTWGRWEQRRLFGEKLAESAGPHFRRHGYCNLPGLLHPSHRAALARYYRTLIEAGEWKFGDDQVAGRFGWHNEWSARFFHHQLTNFISCVAGEEVKPSYTYVSAYEGGATLGRHRDREQCEFTLSVLINESSEGPHAPWPLDIDTEQGTVAITQQLGDAVLFRGCELPHYRSRLPEGQTCACLLFHYVPADFSKTLY
jgi:Sulfotransferase family